MPMAIKYNESAHYIFPRKKRYSRYERVGGYPIFRKIALRNTRMAPNDRGRPRQVLLYTLFN